MPRKLIIIFLAAFLLNFLWEEAHSVLYIHYKGGAITNLILLRAALFDAAVIAFLFLIFYRIRYRELFIALAALVFAVVLERWALGTARWAYTEAMPIIPLLQTGLSPTLQLALTALISWRIAERIARHVIGGSANSMADKNVKKR